LTKVGKFAASFVNAREPGSVAEAVEVRVLAVLQARTRELATATYRLARYTQVLIIIGILQAGAIIAAALIAR
jgi:hypothetical protein